MGQWMQFVYKKVRFRQLSGLVEGQQCCVDLTNTHLIFAAKLRGIDISYSDVAEHESLVECCF